ncbi:MAG: hypothetical protein C4532_14090 [Candidatus Abyssobacteria bacterium SURF_17]|uniref:DUF4276 family protein n=1 Tax=Candidatus Abyssobacteria bacterium SURF_17 TaxID=2093361 RepID=A0A419EUA8_9BACT|nr:MAG: hypothetical protein C4532_14090 [Candidatus Abyssubacteria bacterium SURF_17]
MPTRVIISGAVEGLIDEAVFRRLTRWAGAIPGIIYGKHGKPFLLQRISGYNRVARTLPWLVLVDLDSDADCSPPMARLWLPHPSERMCFRIVVREIEAWLLADGERLARFLGVAPSLMPHNPEMLDDPKHTLVQIASSSRRREIRKDIVPRPRSHRAVGPAYNSRMIEFVSDARSGWRPDVAARSSDSLRRCMHRLQQLVRKPIYST